MLGAGASYHALPIHSNLKSRLEIFNKHILAFSQIYLSNNFSRLKKHLSILQDNISTHYTVDTYAKKLFLKNPNVKTNDEYILLLNYLSAYFLYEQLSIDVNLPCNQYLRDLYNLPYNLENQIDKSLLKELDYRYDSFFATILENNEEGELIIPENFSIISWNYDFQVEKAFMNFSGDSLENTLNLFKVDGINYHFQQDDKKSFLTKLNGTAAFAKDGKYTNLFDFKNHILDEDSLQIISKILIAERNEYDTGMRFAWEKNEISKVAFQNAQFKIIEADIIVIIGYSFPYFNREIDRQLFEHSGRNKGYPKVYIQCAETEIKSVINRFKGIKNIIPIPFVELDQFLIPNEL